MSYFPSTTSLLVPYNIHFNSELNRRSVFTRLNSHIPNSDTHIVPCRKQIYCGISFHTELLLLSIVIILYKKKIERGRDWTWKIINFFWVIMSHLYEINLYKCKYILHVSYNHGTSIKGDLERKKLGSG